MANRLGFTSIIILAGLIAILACESSKDIKVNLQNKYLVEPKAQRSTFKNEIETMDETGLDFSGETHEIVSDQNEDEIARRIMKEEAEYSFPETGESFKRNEYLSWEDYFMYLAFLSKLRSKDPHTQVGACIINTLKRVVGIGYNGFPSGCSDDLLPWTEKDDNWLHTKFPFECHAEINAILNKCGDVCGGTLYVVHFPCNECAKLIVQSGIRKVVYAHERNKESDSSKASRILFGLTGVETRQHVPSADIHVLHILPENSPGQDFDKHVPEQSQSQPQSNQANSRYMEKCKQLLLSEANYTVPSETAKRKDYLTWDDYFMAVAFLSAQRSKDPNTQVGACIVNSSKRIVGIGYNGFPAGCSDNVLPWARTSEKSALHTKYPYVCHAEANAILNKGAADIRGSTIYVALFPCNDCAKLIVQAGIREVVYLHDKYHDTDGCRASRIMFHLAGVRLRLYQPTRHRVVLDLRPNAQG